MLHCRRSFRLAVLLFALPWPGVSPAAAQHGPADAPVPPQVMTRHPDGRVVVRATRIQAPPRIDGVLDDELYRHLQPITDFTQQDPNEGELATEPTLVWIAFDAHTIYVSVRCRDSQPSRIVANEMRRDGRNVSQNDNFSMVLDTFHDRRNGYEFLVNSIGGIWDSQITDERDANREWNAIWVSRSHRDDEGWSVEMAIPFRSLRYRGSGPQVWGINLRRNVRWKNELSYLSPVPRQYGARGILRLSEAATLVGLEAPPKSVNLDVKPYAVGSVTADRAIDPSFSNELDGNAGFDLKYGLTQSLTADVTYRTDFAQVEDDDLQVNLTRFNLFFPEKREFFLEGQGIFAFGGAQTTSTTGTGVPSNTPVLFFSRQIGLNRSQVVPMDVGARLTGRAGPYSIGILDVRTGDSAKAGALATNFAVVRVKRDILRRSYIGILGTHRSRQIDGTGSNVTLGLDTNLSFFQSVNIIGYYAETRAPGEDATGRSYRGRFDYDADLLGVQVERMKVGRLFNPEVGFLRRRDFIQNSVQLRVSRRPRLPAIRRVSVESALDYITDNAERLENRQARLALRTDLESGDSWTVQYSRDFEWVDEPFPIVGRRVPAGTYRFNTVRGGYTFGTQRTISGEVSAANGGFYDGERSDLSIRGRAELSARLSVEPSVSFNWVDLPTTGPFTATLVSARGTLSFTPRMLVAALVQYNSGAKLVATNVRYRWEYRPGSELFLVYSDGRDTRLVPGAGGSALLNRGFTVKLTRLLRT